MKYRVLLYYHFTKIDDVAHYRQKHLDFCKGIDLKGRIYVNEDGINGTVSGTVEQVEKYMNFVKSDKRFKDIFFKIDEASEHAFKKMHVRVRDELVNLSLEEQHDPRKLTGKYLKPAEWRKYLEDENTIVLDTRNDYEHDLGHFRGAIKPDIHTFRELPDWVRKNREMLEGKKILTYCTGGIRCEIFTGWLMKEGFEDVNQLEGGIVTYGKDKEVQGENWDGQLYVFDNRLVVPVNSKNPTVVGKDHFDGSPCERYINCANPECNRQILCSEENEHKHLGGCSYECMVHPRNRYVIARSMNMDEINQVIMNLE